MADRSNSSISVAVIGLGAQGLVTVKNMLEEGFSVTGFERSDYVGGIWHYSAQNKVETLPSTVVNVSRERACFTDFPFSQGTSSFPTAPQVDRYLNEYADHFKLRSYLRLSTTIYSVKRDENVAKWVVEAAPTRAASDANSSYAVEKLAFDKVIVAVGPHSTPKMPELPNKDKFEGTVMHSIAFKDPSQFQGKRVMVVGVGNTAGDTASSLVLHASSVILAHRNGAAVLPRILKDGTSIDHGANYRLFGIKDVLDYYLPSFGKRFVDKWLDDVLKTEWGCYDPAWRLSPVPSLIHQVPTISNTLIPYLRDGSIISTAAPKRVTGPNSIELEDGKIVEVDVIVYCTGYEPNFAFLGQHNPTISPTKSNAHNKQLKPNEALAPSTNFHATPLLYQNIFSLEYPDSLAFIGLALISFPAFLTSDLASMAVAQFWSRKSSSPSLPTTAKMYLWFSNQVLWSQSIRRSSPSNRFPHLHVQNGPWLWWVQTTVGTNVDENLGMLSLRAWRFWLQDRAFCSMLKDGIYSPHLYRLFESDRRKSWSGARAAIEAVNEDVRKMKKAKNATASDSEPVSTDIAKKMPADIVVAA